MCVDYKRSIAVNIDQHVYRCDIFSIMTARDAYLKPYGTSSCLLLMMLKI